MRDYGSINQAEAEAMTEAIQWALGKGKDALARRLACRDEFRALCRQLGVCHVVALERLREQARRERL